MATSKLSSFIQSRFLKMINYLDISVMTAPLIVQIDIKFVEIYIQSFQSSLSLGHTVS